MGLFSARFDREGPGVPKNAPQKKGLARYFEILFRDFGAFWRSYLITAACFIPCIIAVLFGLLFHQYLGMVLIAAVVYILGSFLCGPALLAQHAVIVKAVRDIPGYMWHDYKKAWKENAKQARPVGVAIMVLLALECISVYFYLAMDKINIIMVALVLFCLLILTSASLLIFLQMIFLALPVPGMVKNSLLMTFGYAKRTIPAALFVLVPTIFFAGFVPVVAWMPLLLLGFPMMLTLAADQCLWPVMEQTFHITEQQAAKKAEEEAK